MRSVMILAALALAGSAHAQVYKCVDASGKTVYMQSPCPKGDRATTIDRNAPAAAPAPAAGQNAAPGQKSAAQLEQEFRKRRLEQQEASKKADEQATQDKEKQENCRAAQAQLATLNSGARQMRINAQGEREYLDDSQIQQEKARAQVAIDRSCK